jgi:hypothetical protein
METVEKIEYWRIDSSRLDAIVEDHLGFGWNFVSAEEASNDTEHVVYPDDEYVAGIIGEFDELQSARADEVIGRLVHLKVLPEGTYLVTVCW